MTTLTQRILTLSNTHAADGKIDRKEADELIGSAMENGRLGTEGREALRQVDTLHRSAVYQGNSSRLLWSAFNGGVPTQATHSATALAASDGIIDASEMRDLLTNMGTGKDARVSARAMALGSRNLSPEALEVLRERFEVLRPYERVDLALVDRDVPAQTSYEATDGPMKGETFVSQSLDNEWTKRSFNEGEDKVDVSRTLDDDGRVTALEIRKGESIEKRTFAYDEGRLQTVVSTRPGGEVDTLKLDYAADGKVTKERLTRVVDGAEVELALAEHKYDGKHTITTQHKEGKPLEGNWALAPKGPIARTSSELGTDGRLVAKEVEAASVEEDLDDNALASHLPEDVSKHLLTPDMRDVEVLTRDDQGRPTQSKVGRQELSFTYDGDNLQSVQIKSRDKDTARYEYTYAEGRLVGEKLFDLTGADPVLQEEAKHSVDESGSKVGTLFDATGVKLRSQHANPDGKLIEENWYDKGEPSFRHTYDLSADGQHVTKFVEENVSMGERESQTNEVVDGKLRGMTLTSADGDRVYSTIVERFDAEGRLTERDAESRTAGSILHQFGTNLDTGNLKEPVDIAIVAKKSDRFTHGPDGVEGTSVLRETYEHASEPAA